MRRVTALACAGLALAVLGLQCGSPGTADEAAALAPSASAEAWDVIYGVLQHPRCMNCHPAGDAPLQGDDSHVHLQGVQRGPEGEGLYGMRCGTCHQTSNLDAPHLPPGAPNWHLPKPEMPLVFEGRASRELCLQMRDPTRNGGKSPEQLIEHAQDALVLWGWAPGPGRAPVSTPYADFERAMREWVEGGCGCPPESGESAATEP